jgi:ABC-2 type transport system permease protein
MHEILALIRASWNAEKSYKVNLLLSLASLALLIVPLFLVSGALQPVMEKSIASQSRHYFGFALFGIITVTLISSSISAIPSAVGNAIGRGTLEAFIGTPTPLPVLLTGMGAYGVLWALLRAMISVVFGAALGAQIHWSSLPSTAFILALLILAHVGFGLIVAAAVVCFRTSGPLITGFVSASVFLGGVYYPTQVIPSWLQNLSLVLPLTYGLRAIRRTALLGMPLVDVADDVVMVALFAMTLLAIGTLALAWAMRYARQTATLGQY